MFRTEVLHDANHVMLPWYVLYKILLIDFEKFAFQTLQMFPIYIIKLA